MQAHPQSTPAARIPVTPLPSPQATAQPTPFGGTPSAHPPSNPPSQPTVRHRLTARATLPAEAQSTPELSPAIPAKPIGIAQGAGLAHDAGNLLGALGLYCDLLLAPGVLRPEHVHYATELRLIASRSSELIQRLLAAPRTQDQPAAAARPDRIRSAPISGAPQPMRPHSTALEFQPTDVRRRDVPPPANSRIGLTHASVLRNLAPVLERIAAGAARVSVSAPATLPPIDLPIESLERITVNLVRNAAEAIRTQHLNLQRPDRVPDCGPDRGPYAASPASRPAGQIRVTLAPVAGRLQLTVEDDGPGVPPAVAAAFLQPRPLPANASRGLGHRIVHELVTSSEGQLSIRVRPGQGTAFCIKWQIPGLASPGVAFPSEPLDASIENVRAAHLPSAARAAQSGPAADLPMLSSFSVQGETSPC